MQIELSTYQRTALNAVRRSDLVLTPSGLWKYSHKNHSRNFAPKTIKALEAKGLVIRVGGRVIAMENIR
jgi:hypothetical protein